VEVLEGLGLLVDAVDLGAIEKALVVVELDGPPGFTLSEVEILGLSGGMLEEETGPEGKRKRLERDA